MHSCVITTSVSYNVKQQKVKLLVFPGKNDLRGDKLRLFLNAVNLKLHQRTSSSPVLGSTHPPPSYCSAAPEICPVWCSADPQPETSDSSRYSAPLAFNTVQITSGHSTSALKSYWDLNLWHLETPGSNWNGPPHLLEQFQKWLSW